MLQKEIELNDSEIYSYVVSYSNIDGNTEQKQIVDISIFTPDEWSRLLVTSKCFENAVTNINTLTDSEYAKIPGSYRKLAYYLYFNCPFCLHSNFSELVVHNGRKQDLHSFVFDTIKNKTDKDIIMVNKFRQWINENFHILQGKSEQLIRYE